MNIQKHNRRITSSDEIRSFETKFGIIFPQELTEFIFEFEGAKLDEDSCYYQYQTGFFYELNQVLYLNHSNLGGASIEAILEGHTENGIVGFIPFAVDSGGWDFNISVNDDTYGEVWINKFDSDEEDTMSFVAPSLEVFIKNLGSDI